MATTVTHDPDHGTLTVESGASAVAFRYVHVDNPFQMTWDTIGGGGNGTLTITLHAASGPVGTIVDAGYKLGVLDSSYDPETGTYTFTEKTFGGPQTSGAQAFPDQVLARLVYQAPTLPADHGQDVQVAVTFNAQELTGPGYPTPTTVMPVSATDPDALKIHVNAPVPAAPPRPNFLVFDGTAMQSSESFGSAYAGPVAGLEHEVIMAGPDNLAIAAAAPNAFIVTGSGDDAIDVSASNGDNVLDGGTGSNFLVGGTGNDTFFLDGRDADSAIWSTVSNFHGGDAATLWGITPQNTSLQWLDGLGAPGHTGLTLAIGAAGKPNANLTLAGYTTADLANGRLSLAYGATDPTPGLPGSQYLYIHAN